jgi:putative flippase GtrA
MKALLATGTRFFATSALCALLNMAVLIAGDLLRWHYVASATASFLICVLVGYWLHSRVTFIERLSLRGLLRYTAAMAFNFPLLLGSIWLLHDRVGLAMVWTAPLSTAIGFCYNFIASRWAIHRRLTEQD